MELEEIRKAFPIGTEVVFTWDDDGYEPGIEVELIGIVQNHNAFYFNGDVLGYFDMQVYNRKEKKYYKVHTGNAKLTRAQILDDLLN